MTSKAFQDYYPDEFAHCYGCGRLNKNGLQIKSYWDGEESVCHFKPEPDFTGGFPGNMYGGLIASLIDCHGAGTASAAKMRELGLAMNDRPPSRFVTASLKVDFIKPTPMGKIIELRGRVLEIKDRKVIVNITVSVENEVCAKGEVVMVQLPDSKTK